jgi:hypothetical protein
MLISYELFEQNMIEVNPIIQQIKDLQGREEALRGYL